MHGAGWLCSLSFHFYFEYFYWFIALYVVFILMRLIFRFALYKEIKALQAIYWCCALKFERSTLQLQWTVTANIYIPKNVGVNKHDDFFCFFFA